MKRSARAGVLLLILFLTVLGCTNNPPVIRDIWWMPVTVENRAQGTVRRELMLYVQVEDGEGPADLAEMRLENTGGDIFWKADSSVWKERREGDVLWVGSSSFSGGGDTLTEGSYRLTVEDKGGRTDEIPLELTGWYGEEDLSRHRISEEGDTMTISSSGGGWFFLPLWENGTPEEGKLRSLPVNRPFTPGDYLSDGGGTFYLLLFERNRMALLKEGPYTYLSAE
ncbi:MAG: hypothetical protein JXA95_18115 [Spirochaetales bacterium]|nr:hypothetical protein [Spirochaetales bacterium]